MTFTVTTTRPSRPLAARTRPRRYRPTVLSLNKGGSSASPRRWAPSTSCAPLTSSEKQRMANKLPLSSSRKQEEEEEEKATDYNEVAAALESIYKLRGGH